MDNNFVKEITNIDEDFARWYTDIVLKADGVPIIAHPTEKGKYFFDVCKLTIPVIKTIQINTITSRFARAFALLLSSGLDLNEALNATEIVIGNRYLSKRFHEAAEAVRGGMSLTNAFESYRLFPPMMVQMITIGEKTNALDDVLTRSCKFFDDQVVAGNAEDEEEVPSGGKGSGGDWSDEDADAFIDSGFELDPMVSRYMQPGDDDLVRRALEIVLLEKKASTSYIQRRLKIGYNRAAELIDLMEERGIVGPPSGSGAKRDILVFDDIINQ